MPRVAGIQVEGLSIGGIETCIDLPEWRLCFDVGRVPDAAVPRATVLFTHAHMDHLGGVAWHCATRALRKLAPPTYVIGPENAAAFRDLMDVWRRLDRSTMPHELVVAGPGDEVPLPHGRIARPFRSVHTAPCQGYAIFESRSRLRRELVGISRAEIDERVKRGEPVSERIEVPVFAFCGDTRIEVVEREPVVRAARVLVLECTFLDDRVSVPEAREKGHVHLDEICERADLFENEALVLSHFSARYHPAEIERILARRLPASLRERVTPLLSGARGASDGVPSDER